MKRIELGPNATIQGAKIDMKKQELVLPKGTSLVSGPLKVPAGWTIRGA